MLLRALVLIALIAVIGEAIVSGAAALSRAAFHAREMQIVRDGFATGIERAQDAIAQGTAPQPIATCAASDARGCLLALQTTVALATSAPQTSAQCANQQCAIALQQNVNVAESRQNYTIAVALAAGNGDLLVSRKGTVGFRTFNVPPYATLAGSLDATLDALMNGGTGDDGGSRSQAHGTLIHVLYEAAGGGAAMSADAWRTQSEQPATVSPEWQR